VADVPSDRPRAPRPLIVVGVVTVAGIVLGPWLDGHRLALGLYLVTWGVSWFAGTRAVANDAAYLEYVSRRRAAQIWYRRRVDFVDRDVRFQRRIYRWLYEPVGIGLVVLGIFMVANQLLGPSA
jgi:hypothetical protein